MKESKLFKSLVATLIVLVGPAVALASTSDYSEEVVETTVSYADLNLERDEDVQALLKRLQRASRKVCAVASPMTAGTMAWRACYRNSLSDAIDNFNNRNLSRIYAQN